MFKSLLKGYLYLIFNNIWSRIIFNKNMKKNLSYQYYILKVKLTIFHWVLVMNMMRYLGGDRKAWASFIFYFVFHHNLSILWIDVHISQFYVSKIILKKYLRHQSSIFNNINFKSSSLGDNKVIDKGLKDKNNNRINIIVDIEVVDKVLSSISNITSNSIVSIELKL